MGPGWKSLRGFGGFRRDLLSAGLGNVPVAQTYLDITQGNRVFDSLYSSQLQKLRAGGSCAAWWKSVLERAESAPAEIVPGLLSSTLDAAGVGVRLGGGASCTFSASPPRTAAGASPKKLSGTPQPHPARTFEVRSSSLRQLPALVGGLRGERSPDRDRETASRQRPGAGDRDRRAGVRREPHLRQHPDERVRALHRYRADDLAAAGDRDSLADVGAADSLRGGRRSGAVVSLGNRMAAISGRRGPVIGVALAVWLVGLALAVAATRGRAARMGVRVVGDQRRLPAAGALGGCGGEREPGARTGADDRRRAPAGGADARRPQRLPGAGGRLCGDRPRLRGRRDRRLASHHRLPAGAEPRARGAVLRDRQRAGGAARGAGGRRDRGGPGGVRATALAPGLRRRLPRDRPVPRRDLRRRAVRRRRGSGDRLPGRRRGRRRDGRGTAPPHDAAGRRGAVRGGGAAGPGRPRIRGQRPPDPLGARRGRFQPARRGRPAPPPALRPQLRPPDRLRLPAADPRRRGASRYCGATGCAPGCGSCRRCGPG